MLIFKNVLNATKYTIFTLNWLLDKNCKSAKHSVCTLQIPKPVYASHVLYLEILLLFSISNFISFHKSVNVFELKKPISYVFLLSFLKF